MSVPRIRTVVTPEMLVPAFARAFEKAHGEAPEVVDCAIIVGKMVNECGWWHAKDKNGKPSQACWNLNIGNIRGRSRRGQFCLLAGAYEFRKIGLPLGPGEREIPTPPGAKQPEGTYCYLPDPAKQEFRSYDSIDEACEEYVEVLGRRFGHSWRSLTKSGTTPEEFVAAMKADRYFTGDLVSYQRNVAAVTKMVLPQVEQILAQTAKAETLVTLEILSEGRIEPIWGDMEAGHTVHPEEVDLDTPLPWWRRILKL